VGYHSSSLVSEGKGLVWGGKEKSRMSSSSKKGSLHGSGCQEKETNIRLESAKLCERRRS